MKRGYEDMIIIQKDSILTSPQRMANQIDTQTVSARAMGMQKRNGKKRKGEKESSTN
jgi:hypothetical protein